MKAEISYKGQKITVEGTKDEVFSMIEENTRWEKEQKEPLVKNQNPSSSQNAPEVNIEEIANKLFTKVYDKLKGVKEKELESAINFLAQKTSKEAISSMAKKTSDKLNEWMDKASENMSQAPSSAPPPFYRQAPEENKEESKSQKESKSGEEPVSDSFDHLITIFDTLSLEQKEELLQSLSVLPEGVSIFPQATMHQKALLRLRAEKREEEFKAALQKALLESETNEDDSEEEEDDLGDKFFEK